MAAGSFRVQADDAEMQTKIRRNMQNQQENRCAIANFYGNMPQGG